MTKSIIFSLLTRFSIALINFCILLLGTNYFGKEIIGQVSVVILNLAITQAVAEIYTGSSLIYFLPKFNFKKLYFLGLPFILLSSVVCTSVFYFLNLISVQLLVHNFILSILFSHISFHQNLLLGKEKIKLFNFTLWLQPFILISILACGVFNFWKINFNFYFIAIYFSAFITTLISFISILPLFKKNNLEEFKLSSILKNGFKNQLANLSHILSNRLNYYILASSALVGIYASSTSLIESLWIISAGISPILLSKIANSNDAKSNHNQTFKLAQISFGLSLIGVLLLFCIPNSCFTFLLGKDFSQTKTIMLCLSPGILFISFSSIISHYFSGLGKQTVLLTANLSGLVVAACSAYPLIKNFEIYGACISACLSYLIQSLVLTYYFRKEKNYI